MRRIWATAVFTAAAHPPGQGDARRKGLHQLMVLLAKRADHLLPLPWQLPAPLRVHSRHREGVLWHKPSATDLLFVTLKKSEALFCPSTRTRDLALGPSLFHWESWGTTTAAAAFTASRPSNRSWARGYCCLCGSSANRGASPNRFIASGSPATKATWVSGR